MLLKVTPKYETFDSHCIAIGGRSVEQPPQSEIG